MISFIAAAIAAQQHHEHIDVSHPAPMPVADAAPVTASTVVRGEIVRINGNKLGVQTDLGYVVCFVPDVMRATLEELKLETNIFALGEMHTDHSVTLTSIETTQVPTA